jgi:hypothetical protein
VLTEEQAVIALKALQDAENYRRVRADRWCASCERHPAGACDDHVNDLDLADEFRGVAAELARQLPPGFLP